MYGTWKHTKTHSFSSSSSFFRSFFFLFFSFLFFSFPFFLPSFQYQFSFSRSRFVFSFFVPRSPQGGSFSRRGEPCNGNEESGKGSRVSNPRGLGAFICIRFILYGQPLRPVHTSSSIFSLLTRSNSFFFFPFFFFFFFFFFLRYRVTQGRGVRVKGVGGREGRTRRDDDTRFVGKRFFFISSFSFSKRQRNSCREFEQRFLSFSFFRQFERGKVWAMRKKNTVH